MSKHKHFHSLKNSQKAYYGGKGGLVPRRPRLPKPPEKRNGTTSEQ